MKSKAIHIAPKTFSFFLFFFFVRLLSLSIYTFVDKIKDKGDHVRKSK